MGTSQPVRRSHDIPLVKPEPLILPLPAADPSRILTPFIPVPDRWPIEVPRKREEVKWL